jgi:hypothetical protein
MLETKQPTRGQGHHPKSATILLKKWAKSLSTNTKHQSGNATSLMGRRTISDSDIRWGRVQREREIDRVAEGEGRSRRGKKRRKGKDGGDRTHLSRFRFNREIERDLERSYLVKSASNLCYHIISNP